MNGNFFFQLKSFIQGFCDWEFEQNIKLFEFELGVNVVKQNHELINQNNEAQKQNQELQKGVLDIIKNGTNIFYGNNIMMPKAKKYKSFLWLNYFCQK